MAMKLITNLELQNRSGYSSEFDLMFRTANTLRVELLDGTKREVVSPKLGRDYISGALEDEKTFGVFLKRSCKSIEFGFVADPGLKELVFTRNTVGETLTQLEYPAQMRVQYLDDRSRFQNIRTLGIYRGFLVTDYYLNPAIPLAALGAIEVSCG